MGKAIDITGQKFGRLTVIRRATKDETNIKSHAMWVCNCDCGNMNIIVPGTELRKEHGTRSCGCLKSEQAKKHAEKINKTKPAKKPFNDYTIKNTIVTVYCKDKQFTISKKDLTKINLYHWYIDSTGYPAATINGKKTRLHNLLLGKWVDHKDNNPLNNTRSNLRICTPSQNMANKTKAKNKSSKYKGVHWNEHVKKWAVEIRKDGKREYLGIYTDEIEAANVYDKRAIELFGEFAKINFPKETSN